MGWLGCAYCDDLCGEEKGEFAADVLAYERSEQQSHEFHEVESESPDIHDNKHPHEDQRAVGGDHFGGVRADLDAHEPKKSIFQSNQKISFFQIFGKNRILKISKFFSFFNCFSIFSFFWEMAYFAKNLSVLLIGSLGFFLPIIKFIPVVPTLYIPKLSKKTAITLSK